MYFVGCSQKSPGRQASSLQRPAVFSLLFIVFQITFVLPSNHRISADAPSSVLGGLTSKSNQAIYASVPGVFSLPVIQQPGDKAIYVANRSGVLTQFQMASRNGIIGLMAHNYLSGKDFYKLDVGKNVRVIYTDRHIGRYQVTSIHRFQKLKPTRLYSDFIDLDTGQRWTTRQVFDQFYRGEPHVTFQTCLEGEGRLDWGILFIIASPVIE